MKLTVAVQDAVQTAVVVRKIKGILFLLRQMLYLHTRELQKLSTHGFVLANKMVYPRHIYVTQILLNTYCSFTSHSSHTVGV